MREAWDRAEFTDEATGRLEAFLNPSSGLWFPPHVVTKSRRLYYPCPKKVAVPISGDFLFSLYDHGWKTEPEVDEKRLLEGFLRLSKPNDERIREFAQNWGPLWLCVKHRNCYCFPDIFGPPSTCMWLPIEPIEEFRRMSRKVQAALDISACLKLGKKTTPDQWEHLFGAADLPPSKVQSILLTTAINRYIHGPWGAYPELRWYEKSPEFSLNSGFGFLPLVWMQVAQVLSGARSVSRCDGCEKWYVRTRRKPARGRNNFCDDCSKGARGSKKIWARKHAQVV
jgi:hypothetical protein